MQHINRNCWLLAAPLALVFFASCEKAPKPEEKIAQQTFASPADAGTAFLAAAQSGDQAALLKVFGPDAQGVLFSGDPVKDKDALADFVAAYGQMHRWIAINAGGQVLVVGADNFPFPIPLQQNTAHQWYFNTAAGKDEILARRIGKDELTALAACGSLFDAQEKYFSQTHDGSKVKQYARQFASDPGKQNGLYWSVPAGQPESPLGQLGDFAKKSGYTGTDEKPQPFDGYLYRILTKQGDKAKGGAKDYVVDGNLTGGFAIVAYPVQYRNSGIMTFIVSKDGVIYQKDLGEKTTDIATAMADYNPGDGWTPALGSN
jgi:Protein of unknown function (DUF2950)